MSSAEWRKLNFAVIYGKDCPRQREVLAVLGELENREAEERVKLREQPNGH